MKTNIKNFRSSRLQAKDLYPIVGGTGPSTTRSGTAVTRSYAADADNAGNDYDQ